MHHHRITAIFFAIVLCCSMPVMGVTTYLGGSPHMSAAISGTNEFSPGQEAVISVIVQNRGVNVDKFVMEGTIERDDLPTTAKMVKVGLSSAAAPITIQSDPQNVGDLASQQTATVRIAAKITSDATSGEYTLPLTIRYTYLAASSQDAADILQNDYREGIETIPITVRIKPQIKIVVLEAVPENLSVGTGGYLNLTIQNGGFEDGKKATVKLIRNGNSPVIPIDSNVFIGDFPRNGIVSCRYRVAISDNAENQTYPVDVAVSYENRDGEMVTSAPDTAGVRILGKIRFAVVSEPVTVAPGSDSVITVRYQNTGAVTAYHAQARLSAAEPFVSADNSAYLGDMKAGDIATATYRISTDSGATAQGYLLDTEVRYRDALDNSQVSDTFRVNIQVSPGSQPAGIAVFLPLILIAAAALCAGYYLLILRKKK